MLTPYKNVLFEAAYAAGEIIQSYFQGSFKVGNKEGINNLVTEVDTKAEARIIEIIQSYYPDHFIVSEEVGELTSDSSYKWIIDTIDGTVNFAQKRYELGLTNTVEYLTVQNNQFIAESNLLSAKYDLIFKLKVIDYYLGKELKL